MRVAAWEELTGKSIRTVHLTLGEDYDQLLELIRVEQPDTIVHFAEQRAAPYSMKSSWHKRYTVNNNINATNDVLCAIVESGLDIHLVHLGTMGVYGYGTAGMKIPEGYLRVKIETPQGLVDQEILYPANPGLHLPHDQDPGCAAVLLLQQKRRICGLPISIRASSGAPRPIRPGATSG